MRSVLVVGARIGKTFFALQQLAAITLMSGAYVRSSLWPRANASSLAGSSTFGQRITQAPIRGVWRGESRLNAVANPLVILDKVDKTHKTKLRPFGATLRCCQTETARNFEDQSHPMC
jgi:hypothetical protein